MQNRVSANPGRVKITPESGGEAYFATVERADNPTVEGTPLNKESLLQDDTCDLLDIPRTSTPNEAFLKLALGAGKYGYTLHFKYPNGAPAAGFAVSGLTSITDEALTTDSTGTVFGVSTSKSITAGLNTGYDDLKPVSQTIASTGILTEVTITLSYVSFPLFVDTSKTVKFSPAAPKMNICAVGAGGSGGAARGYRPSLTSDADQGWAMGGSGGYVKTLSNQTVANKSYACTIGKGGAGKTVSSASGWHASTGNDGGTTSVLVDGSSILSADGGKGGKAYWNNNYLTSTGVAGVAGGTGTGGIAVYQDENGETQIDIGTAGSNGGSGGWAQAYAGGQGQGTTTSFAGTLYSGSGGSTATGKMGKYGETGEYVSKTTNGAQGGGGRGITGSSPTGGNGSVRGAGGGGAQTDVSSGSVGTVKSGAGADGRVIFQKAA